jgi:hypothetical protein
MTELLFLKDCEKTCSSLCLVSQFLMLNIGAEYTVFLVSMVSRISVFGVASVPPLPIGLIIFICLTKQVKSTGIFNRTYRKVPTVLKEIGIL